MRQPHEAGGPALLVNTGAATAQRGDRSTGRAGTPGAEDRPRTGCADWAVHAPGRAHSLPRHPRSLHLRICLVSKTHFDPQIHTRGFSKSLVDTRRAVRSESGTLPGEVAPGAAPPPASARAVNQALFPHLVPDFLHSCFFLKAEACLTEKVRMPEKLAAPLA